MEAKKFSIIKNGGVTSPAGFMASGICAGLKKSGKTDMASFFPNPAKASAAFTTCLFAAAPVLLGRETLKRIRKSPP